MLNKICTDLETSIKLKEIGIDFDAYFYWNTETVNLETSGIKSFIKEKYLVKAYTLEQILGMIPDQFHDKIARETAIKIFDKSSDDNQATTAGKLLIKLKEGKII